MRSASPSEWYLSLDFTLDVVVIKTQAKKRAIVC